MKFIAVSEQKYPLVLQKYNILLVTPSGNTRYPLYRRLGESQCRSGRVRKVSTSPVFYPRTVQSVASRNTDCAMPAHVVM